MERRKCGKTKQSGEDGKRGKNKRRNEKMVLSEVKDPVVDKRAGKIWIHVEKLFLVYPLLFRCVNASL